MIEYRLKDSTKDIDIVCRSEEDKKEILRYIRELGYELVWPEKRHARLGLNRIAIKGGHILDVFADKPWLCPRPFVEVEYSIGFSGHILISSRKGSVAGE